jgi:hypothetical protein
VISNEGQTTFGRIEEHHTLEHVEWNGSLNMVEQGWGIDSTQSIRQAHGNLCSYWVVLKYILMLDLSDLEFLVPIVAL